VTSDQPGKASFDKLRVEMWVSGTAGEDGKGGYCTLLHSCILGQHYKKTLAGFATEGATVTRMTLKAVVEGLQAIKNPSFIHIYTSIPVVSSGLNKYIHKWSEQEFRKAKGDVLQHQDLWMQIYKLLNEKSLGYKVHYLGKSPSKDNNVEVVHTASLYAQHAKKQFAEVAIS